jgi:hypothetical protein
MGRVHLVIQRLSLPLLSGIGVISNVATLCIYTHDVPYHHISCNDGEQRTVSELPHCMADPLKSLCFI